MTTIRDIPIQEIIETGSYEDYVNLGMHVKSNMDQGRWTIGDMASKIRKGAKRGSKIVQKYAGDIGENDGTVRAYANMSEYWTPDKRNYVREHFNVNWSHLREAKRFKDVNESIAFLHRCHALGLNSVAEYSRQVALDQDIAIKPRKLTRVNLICTRNEEGRLTFHTNEASEEDTEQMIVGAEYLVDVFEIREDQP